MENGARAAHIPGMRAGWKFVGEFRRGRKEPLALECIIAIPDRKKAQAIAREKLVGADNITAIEISRIELRDLNLRDGDVYLFPQML
jgi:hypothetical protein